MLWDWCVDTGVEGMDADIGEVDDMDGEEVTVTEGNAAAALAGLADGGCTGKRLTTTSTSERAAMWFTSAAFEPLEKKRIS